MKMLAAALLSVLAYASAAAQDVRPGIASIAVVTTEADGRYGMDGDVVKASRLRRTLVELDSQLAIGYLHLREGAGAIDAGRLDEIRRIADEIGARLMVEKDGRMEPADAPASPGA